MVKSSEGVVVDAGALSNDAEFGIGLTTPYSLDVVLEGTTSLIFHRFSVERYEEQKASKKGSAVRNGDDPESYLFRTSDGEAGVPAEYVYRSMINAGKRFRDPSRPRASAMDLYKAGVIVGPEIATLGKVDYDYLDQRRAVVNRAAIPRMRPAFLAGWRAEFTLDVLMPDLLSPNDVREVLSAAGRFVGLGEMRPTYGRFAIVKFDVRETE